MKKLLLILTVALWCAATAVGQGGQRRDRVQAVDGRAMGGQTISVCAYSGADYTAGLYTGAIPCSPLVTIYKDFALALPMTPPSTGGSMLSDSGGNYAYFVAAAYYTECVTGTHVNGVCYLVNAFGSGVLTNISNTFTVMQTFKDINNVVYATQFAGADIFAKANVAAASITPPGRVVIDPGTYTTVTTTLNCVSDVEFYAAGVHIVFSGVTGSAIAAQSTAHCKITGPLHILGTRTAGTVGIYLGNPASGAGLTTENKFQDITIGDAPNAASSGGFGIGVMVDGNLNSGTYYNEFDRVSSNGNLNQGWLWKPTLSARANSNTCVNCTAVHNGGDGLQLDGVFYNSFFKIDTESNGACGLNFQATTTTSSNSFFGGDSEGNTTADTCWGGPSGTNAANVTSTTVQAVNQGSSTPVVGNPAAGTYNVYWAAGSTPAYIGYFQTPQVDWPVGLALGTNSTIWIRDTETGNANIFRIQRSGVGTGSVAVGTAGYPGVFTGSSFVPKTAGGADLGSTSLPFGNLWLGTAATNNFKFQPAATAAARVISIPDPLVNANLAFNLTATSAAFATATTAGTCVQNTTAVTGAATTMAVSVSPVSTPGVGAVWSAFVSSPGNVTINECAVAASAGGSVAFNIRVTP